FEHPPSPSPLKGLHLSFVFPPLREGKKQVVAEPPPPAMFWQGGTTPYYFLYGLRLCGIFGKQPYSFFTDAQRLA
ncbi:MAG: hypothetical protein IJ069_06780, partial [Prevotella sp.]|nr:hypothetical protein [Prevotella sp.]